MIMIVLKQCLYFIPMFYILSICETYRCSVNINMIPDYQSTVTLFPVNQPYMLYIIVMLFLCHFCYYMYLSNYIRSCLYRSSFVFVVSSKTCYKQQLAMCISYLTCLSFFDIFLDFMSDTCIWLIDWTGVVCAYFALVFFLLHWFDIFVSLNINLENSYI